jgi:hypothetical protein
MRSALTNMGHPASRGRNSRAKVVFPAPFGPAMMKQTGTFFFISFLPPRPLNASVEKQVEKSAIAFPLSQCGSLWQTMSAIFLFANQATPPQSAPRIHTPFETLPYRVFLQPIITIGTFWQVSVESKNGYRSVIGRLLEEMNDKNNLR